MGGAGFGIIICDADAAGRQWDSPGPVRENKEKRFSSRRRCRNVVWEPTRWKLHHIEIVGSKVRSWANTLNLPEKPTISDLQD